MSKIQDVPFITKVIDTLSDELKSGLYDLIDGKEKTPVFRSLVNNDYAITEANDKGKVQFVTLETLRGNYTGYLAYNSVYCVLIAFKGNTQALDMLNINVAKHTFAFVNESLSILELRVELEDGKEGVTPTDLKSTNNNVYLAKGTTQIGKGVNVKTINGETLFGSGNIVVGDTGTVDGALDDDSVNPVQNKVIYEALQNLDMSNIVDSDGHKRFVEGNLTLGTPFANLGVTMEYGKWQLSGGHLMLVVALKIPSGVTTPTNALIARAILPQWIENKLVGLWSNTLDIKDFFVRNSVNWYQNINILKNVIIYKVGNNTLYISSSDTLTTEAESTCRIQFDFIIDGE